MQYSPPGLARIALVPDFEGEKLLRRGAEKVAPSHLKNPPRETFRETFRCRQQGLQEAFDACRNGVGLLKRVRCSRPCLAIAIFAMTRS
jgi:hypothetical protein